MSRRAGNSYLPFAFRERLQAATYARYDIRGMVVLAGPSIVPVYMRQPTLPTLYVAAFGITHCRTG